MSRARPVASGLEPAASGSAPAPGVYDVYMQMKERVTVTIPSDVLVAARRDVQSGAATSLSAWITEAAEAKARRESLSDVLADIANETGGPLTDEERQWARQQLTR